MDFPYNQLRKEEKYARPKWLSMLSLVALAIPTVVANQVIFAREKEKAIEGITTMNPLEQTG